MASSTPEIELEDIRTPVDDATPGPVANDMVAIHVDIGRKIGLSLSCINNIPFDAFKIPTERQSTSSDNSSMFKTELIATLISNKVSSSKSFKFISLFLLSNSLIKKWL